MAGLRAPLLRVQAGTGRGDLLSYCGGVGTNRTSGEDRGDGKVTGVKGPGYILGGGGRIVYAVLVADLSWGDSGGCEMGMVDPGQACTHLQDDCSPPSAPSTSLSPPSLPSLIHPSSPHMYPGGGGGRSGKGYQLQSDHCRATTAERWLSRREMATKGGLSSYYIVR